MEVIWDDNKSIGGQVSMLDGWEELSYTIIPSPLKLHPCMHSNHKNLWLV